MERGERDEGEGQSKYVCLEAAAGSTVGSAIAGQLCKSYTPYTGATSSVVPAFWVNRYEREAAKNWEFFYRRNRDRFFKDRHYLQAEWNELLPAPPTGESGRAGAASSLGTDSHEEDIDQDAQQVTGEEIKTLAATGLERLVLLEAGCGVGNTIFPLLRTHPALFAYAFDFSETAVSIVKAHPLAHAGRVIAGVGDLTTGRLPSELAGCTADICTLIFVLSAIAPDKFGSALGAIASGLREGGVVLLRDYAIGDGAQARLEGRRAPKRLDAKAAWMVRQDGTLAYYFTTEELSSMFDEAGFDTLQCEVTQRTTSNRAKGITLTRRFISARFRKRAVKAT